MMAARRKRTGRREPEGARAFAVVVEEMRGHFKAFGERLDGLDEKVTGLDEKVTGLDEKVTAGFARVDERFAQIDERFAQIDERFAQVDARFAQVDESFAEVKHELGLVKTVVLEHGRLLKEKVDRDEVEAVVERVVARTSGRQ
jgi:hypothetical protein